MTLAAAAAAAVNEPVGLIREGPVRDYTAEPRLT